MQTAGAFPAHALPNRTHLPGERERSRREDGGSREPAKLVHSRWAVGISSIFAFDNAPAIERREAIETMNDAGSARGARPA